VAGAW